MGISIGSECSGGIRNVRIEDNHVGVCLPGHCENGCCGWSPALHLKSTATRGGHMKDIVFRNNTIYNTTSVILLENDYQSHGETNEDRYAFSL
jgi:polygalacturonase